MITILNYPFELLGDIEIEMPDYAKILDIQEVNGKWTMWVMADTDHPMVKRKFKTFWTFEKMSALDSFRTHIKTIQDLKVWHIFE